MVGLCTPFPQPVRPAGAPCVVACGVVAFVSVVPYLVLRCGSAIDSCAACKVVQVDVKLIETKVARFHHRHMAVGSRIRAKLHSSYAISK